MVIRLQDEKFLEILAELENATSADRVAFFSEKNEDKFLLWWMFYYHEDFITLLGDFHYNWIEALFSWKNVFIEWFRWSIKTTIVIAYTTYEISNWFCKFVNWQSYDDWASTRNTTNIAIKLLNPLLIKDYWKILALTWWNKEDLQKKSVWDFDTTNWIKVMATSLWQKLRWSISRNARPDRLIIDDIDVSDSVRNPEIINKNYEKLTWETFGALSKELKTQIIFLWNTILADWIVPRFRKSKSNSKWWAVFHQPLIVWWKIVWDFFTKELIEKIKEDEELPAFNQNYMLIPLIHHWTPVFDIEKVQQLKELKYITSNKYKELRFYKKPCECVFGVDVAWWNANWDYSTITAYNYNKELVLSYAWKIAPDQLWELIEYIFKQWYYWKIIPERNSIWLALLDKLKVWPCRNYLFFEKSIDKVTAKPTKKFWFSTNSKSKPLIISKMEEWIRKWEVIEFDERTKQEIYNYYYDETSTNALNWSHDDLVMSTALCFYWLEQPRIVQFI